MDKGVQLVQIVDLVDGVVGLLGHAALDAVTDPGQVLGGRERTGGGAGGSGAQAHVLQLVRRRHLPEPGVLPAQMLEGGGLRSRSGRRTTALDHRLRRVTVLAHQAQRRGGVVRALAEHARARGSMLQARRLTGLDPARREGGGGRMGGHGAIGLVVELADGVGLRAVGLGGRVQGDREGDVGVLDGLADEGGRKEIGVLLGGAQGRRGLGRGRGQDLGEAGRRVSARVAIPDGAAPREGIDHGRGRSWWTYRQHLAVMPTRRGVLEGGGREREREREGQEREKNERRMMMKRSGGRGSLKSGVGGGPGKRSWPMRQRAWRW